MAAPRKKQSKALATTQASSPPVTYTPAEDITPKIYVHVKAPDDHASLLKLKKTLNDFSGDSEIILVLGEPKESAIRLPFRAVASDKLQAAVESIYGIGSIKFV